jgi:hypothetical protein
MTCVTCTNDVSTSDMVLKHLMWGYVHHSFISIHSPLFVIGFPSIFAAPTVGCHAYVNQCSHDIASVSQPILPFCNMLMKQQR